LIARRGCPFPEIVVANYSSCKDPALMPTVDRI
jgi:hypothetical protein